MLFILSSCSSLKYLDAYDGFKNQPIEVESITYRIIYTDSLSKEEMGFKVISSYDTKGRKIQSKDFKSDGSPSSGGTKYTYDKYGNLIKYIRYNIDSTINVQNNYKFNKYGQQTEREYISGEKKSITKYDIDRKNKLNRETIRENDVSISSNSLLKYDSKWRDFDVISYDNSGNQESKIVFEYDENGNQILSRWYNSKNKLYTFYKTTYNFNNDRIQIEKFSISNGEEKLVDKTKFEYKYDLYGNCIEEKLINNGKASWITRNNIKYVW